MNTLSVYIYHVSSEIKWCVNATMFHIQSCHDIIFQISSNEGTYPTWKPVATVSLWSDVFTGTLCGLLAQGWANPVGESWDFAESSIPSLISVVVARVFMFTTGQLNICCDESSLHYETNWLNQRLISRSEWPASQIKTELYILKGIQISGHLVSGHHRHRSSTKTTRTR